MRLYTPFPFTRAIGTHTAVANANKSQCRLPRRHWVSPAVSRILEINLNNGPFIAATGKIAECLTSKKADPVKLVNYLLRSQLDGFFFDSLLETIYSVKVVHVSLVICTFASDLGELEVASIS